MREGDAWREFRDPIVRVARCIDRTTRLVERDVGQGIRLLGTAPDGMPFGPTLTLQFSLTLGHVEKNGEPRMTTLRYTFTLLDAATRERVFAWHWHPFSKRSKIAYPHVHPPSGSPFSTHHVPTGRMCLEDVILYGFDDLGIQPAYPNGRQIVLEVRDRHKLHRGWS